MKSRGIMMGALAIGFIVVAWYMMVYSKTKDDVSSTKSQVSEAQDENVELTSEKQELESLEDSGPEIELKLQALQSAVPAQPELATFIDEVDALGAQAGIDWVSVAPSEPTLANGVGTVQLTIQVNGDYFKVIDYLGKIEGMSRLVVIDTINVTDAASAEGGSGATEGELIGLDGPKLSVTLTARMFTQAVPNAEPAPDATAAGDTTPTTSATTNVAEG